MFDKNILIKRFKKSLNTYSDNAIIQKEMVDKLLSYLPKKKYDNVLEIGCGTGILTNKFTKEFVYKNYLATDIVDDCKTYVNVNFKQTDMDSLVIDRKYDLIISNAAIQWSNDFDKLISKITGALNHDGILALTTFGPQNMLEIKELFGVGLNYLKIEDIEKKFTTLDKIKLGEELRKIQFKNLFDTLKHIKKTGTNIFKSNMITKTKLIELSELYEKQYNNILTYNPIYIVYQKFN